MSVIRIFTDGACSGNPGNGGWGVVIIKDKEISKHNGSENDTTNNRMELKAAIEGIKLAADESAITLYTDSKYVKDGITTWIDNWKKNNWLTSTKKPVKNQDLWQELDKLNEKYQVSWKWVKGHQIEETEDSRYNNLADELARNAVKL
mgnify:FL=1|tara:strand:+ start:482 stop:925 length:444 start_codon:yes stop_codon:yes gene_type:complete